MGDYVNQPFRVHTQACRHAGTQNPPTRPHTPACPLAPHTNTHPRLPRLLHELEAVLGVEGPLGQAGKEGLLGQVLGVVASQRASKPVSQRASEPVSQSASQPVSQPVKLGAGESASERRWGRGVSKWRWECGSSERVGGIGSDRWCRESESTHT